VLPRDYGTFESKVLEDLMRLFNSEQIKQATGDVFGRIYEYFSPSSRFQKAHDNGEFFTPSSLVQTIVNLIEPDHGIVFDPACGSGGMFVQSSHFIEHAGGDTAKKCQSLEDGDWIESKDQGGEDYRLLQISNIGVNEFVETGNYRYIIADTVRRLNCREIRPGQILISRMPKPIGRAWLVTEMPWRVVTSVDVAVLTPKTNVADSYFIVHHLNAPASLEMCAQQAVGATRPRIACRELAALPIVVPPIERQRHFREFAEPLNEQRANLHQQNSTLRAARDLLLPRLMSGEVPV